MSKILNSKFYYCNLYSVAPHMKYRVCTSYSVKRADKVFLKRIVVENIDGKHFKEILTGKIYDSSYTFTFDKYFSFLNKYILFFRKRKSSKPVHISFLYQDYVRFHYMNQNFCIADDDIIKYYTDMVINDFGSCDEYLNFLNEQDEIAKKYCIKKN